MIKKVIIADDHSMIRKGIKLLLMTQLNIPDQNIYETNSCNGLMNQLKSSAYTHLILDVIFADGTALEIIPVIHSLYKDLKILVFSMQLKEVYSEAFSQYGIHCYLNKASNEEDTTHCIKRFINNDDCKTCKLHYSHKFISKNPFSLLSPRELEILHYLLNGYKTGDIASSLNLSNSTVSTLKKRIYEKTEITSLSQLVELATLYNINF